VNYDYCVFHFQGNVSPLMYRIRITAVCIRIENVSSLMYSRESRLLLSASGSNFSRHTDPQPEKIRFCRNFLLKHVLQSSSQTQKVHNINFRYNYDIYLHTKNANTLPFHNARIRKIVSVPNVQILIRIPPNSRIQIQIRNRNNAYKEIEKSFSYFYGDL
jgi:hypothetical protein